MTLPSAQMNVQVLLFGKVRVRMRVRGEPEGGTKMNKVRAHFGGVLNYKLRNTRIVWEHFAGG